MSIFIAVYAEVIIIFFNEALSTLLRNVMMVAWSPEFFVSLSRICLDDLLSDFGNMGCLRKGRNDSVDHWLGGPNPIEITFPDHCVCVSVLLRSFLK
jgi:hypothetical protein